MKKEVIIAPSLLAADFSRLTEEVKAIENTNAKWLHLDVMDGNFVPNISFGADIIKAIRKDTNLYFDAHLMIEKPEWYIDAIANAGVQSISVHVESTNHLDRALQLIKAKGIKAGVAINPATDIALHENIYEKIE